MIDSGPFGRPCPNCGGQLVLYDPLHYGRFYKCVGKPGEKDRKCAAIIWHDGPPLLPPLDPQRKRAYSDRLIPLTEEGVEWLKNL